jgi:hypothetical protein
MVAATSVRGFITATILTLLLKDSLRNFFTPQQQENLNGLKEAFQLDLRVGPSCADLQGLAVDISKRCLLGWSSWT